MWMLNFLVILLQDMKGAQILAMLDQGLRLSRPTRCPEAIYSVMQQCWNSEGARRPSFSELVLTMSRLAKGPLFPNNFSNCHADNTDQQQQRGNATAATVTGDSSAGAFAFFWFAGFSPFFPLLLFLFYILPSKVSNQKYTPYPHSLCFFALPPSISILPLYISKVISIV